MIAKIREVEERFPKLSEVIRFLIVGVVVNLIDMFVMSLIMYFPNKGDYGSYLNVFTMKGISPTWLTVLATSIGFVVGLVFNYIFSLWFVYDGENKNAKTKKGIILFAVFSVIGLCIQSFGMWLFCDLFHLNEWIIKIILIIVVLIFNYITRKFFVFNDKETKEIDIVKIIKSEPGQGYAVSLRELLFNLGFAVSAFFYSSCVFENILDFNYNTIAKFVLSAVVVIMALFYLFIVDTKLISRTFEDIKNHKTEFVLSSLATVFYEYIIFVEHLDLNASNIVFALLSAFVIFTLFMLAYKFIVKKIKEFYKSLSKSEKIFILVTFIGTMLLNFISLMLTKMFVGIPEETWRYEVYSLDPGYLYYWNTYTNPFAFNNNIRHLLFSYSFLPFSVIPYAFMHMCHIHSLFGIVMQIYQFFMIAIMIIVFKRMLKIKNLYTEIAFYLFTFLASSFFINMIVYEKFVVTVFFVILTLNAVMQLSLRHS
ncbi:MAG: GtrA family protein, partial [Clostridia bacterium]|nr:GtrA family protein [Clostridia bacterium]